MYIIPRLVFVWGERLRKNPADIWNVFTDAKVSTSSCPEIAKRGPHGITMTSASLFLLALMFP